MGHPPRLVAIHQARWPSADGPTRWLEGSVTLQNGRIEQLRPKETSPGAPEHGLVLDAAGCTLLPGFVDVHVHGGDGFDTMDATPEALLGMARFFARHGVTAFCPTTITAPQEAIRRAVANVAQVLESTPEERWPGARILGVHLEGPYISPQYPGAQPAQFIREPDVAEFLELVAAGPVSLITLAPEQPGAEALIAAAQERGVGAVLGHTAASYDQAVAAIRQGASQATHTFNAMTGLHHRRPGTVGAVLSQDAIRAQLIADNIHVHPAVMDILGRCKGVEGTILITDAMRAAGLPPGQYDLGGQTVTVAEGACRLANGSLAGSILTMDRALANFLAATGWPLEQGWPVSSRTPARSLGLGREMGAVAPGYRADLVLLDEDLQAVATVVGGRLVYLRDEERLG